MSFDAISIFFFGKSSTDEKQFERGTKIAAQFLLTNAYLCHFLCPSPSPWTSLLAFLSPSPFPCPSLWNVAAFLCAPSPYPSLWTSPLVPSLCPWTVPSPWNVLSPSIDPFPALGIYPYLCPCRALPSDEGSSSWWQTDLPLLAARLEAFPEAAWTSLAWLAEALSLVHPSLAGGRSQGSNCNQRTAAAVEVVVVSSHIVGHNIQRMHREGSAVHFGCSRQARSQGRQRLQQVVQPASKLILL